MAETRFCTLYIGRDTYPVYRRSGDGHVDELSKEQAEEYFNSLDQANREFYNNFEGWWDHKHIKHRTWTAEIVDANGTQEIDLGGDVYYPHGYPVQVAMRLLENLARQGWRLVHVSEDHGLYSGVDASNEAYPARVRYLHVNSA